MILDPNNPIVKPCAAGMAIDGSPSEARALFDEAWAERTDDHEAAIAAVATTRSHLAALPPGGYRDFVSLGIDRLEARLTSDPSASSA